MSEYKSDTEMIRKHGESLRDLLSKLGRWPHVLLVDDDLNDTLLALNTLLQFKVYISTCTDPNRAADIIKHGNFDVVLMDVVMPQMSGDQIIAENLGLPGTHFVVVTGKTEPDLPVLSKAIKIGAMLWFEKPLNETKLAILFERRFVELQSI